MKKFYITKTEAISSFETFSEAFAEFKKLSNKENYQELSVINIHEFIEDPEKAYAGELSYFVHSLQNPYLKFVNN